MNAPESLTHRRCFVFDVSPERLLMAMRCQSPWFIQAANALAVLATVEPLGDMAGACCGQQVFFPENGLDLAINDVARIHLVELQGPTGTIVSVEFALAGDPRALTIAAPPGHPDAVSLRIRLERLKKHLIAEKTYQEWCHGYTREPVLCPCCKEAAQKRRTQPAAHPAAGILRHAMDQSLPLRCTLKSNACGLTTTIQPAFLDFDDGGIQLTGIDGSSQLGIDPGLCHAIAVEPLTLDGEKHSVFRLMDSLGRINLEISTPGWYACKVWVEICRSTNGDPMCGRVP